MARFWKGVVLTSYQRERGNFFSWAGPGGLAFFHLTKKEVSQWQMKK